LKLVQEKAGNTLEAMGIGKDFLSRTQTAQQLRERIKKLDYMKLKSFYTTKEMVSKLKRPLAEWENIFASYISDKRLRTRIYRELKKLNSPKINDPRKKWGQLNRTEHFQRKKPK
jgi:abortive infection bacteriophage resistance protein